MGAQAVRLSNVDIDNALKNKDFEVLFQPIFDLGNGALARMETFVRWRHPSLGVLPPGAFISFFESQGRMSELTRYVLGEALDHYCEWRGPYAPGFSINLALSDLNDEAFASHFSKMARDRDFPADLVTFECPMPPVDADLAAASASFARLSDTGARLAIEVRGRANDFLKEIDPFPFDEIKTGGSSILRFARTVRGPGLSAISDLLDIANRANAAITAVGVEDQASLAALRGLGFTAAQGNHLGKVGDLKEFRSARVNEVRELLELEPLSQESLTALFRTEAPEPKAAEPTETSQSDADEPKQDDALVERLNERVAKQSDTEQSKAAADEEAKKKKAAARERALAKKAKQREARKSAAIARAKSKAAQGENTSETQEANAHQPHPENAAPRDLQQRLSKEFANSPTTGPKSSTPKPKKATAPQPVTGEAPSPKQEKRPTVSTKAPKDKDEKPSLPDAARAPAQSKSTSVGTAPIQPPSVGIEKVALGSTNVAAALIPEIRVGAPGPRAKAQPDALAAAAAPQFEPASADPVAETSPAETLAPSTEEHTSAQPQHENPEQSSEQEAVAAPAAAASIPEIVGGQAYEEAKETQTEEDAPKRKRRKPTNFLTRKYQIWPTHFWPKSWKRAWRQKALEREAARRESETEAAELETS